MAKKKKEISIDAGNVKWAPPGPDKDFPSWDNETTEAEESDYFASKTKEFDDAGVQTGELSLSELVSIIRNNVNDVLIKHGLIDDDLQDENETDLKTTYASAQDKQHLKDAGVENINEQTYLRFKILSGIKTS